ncbi:hypothetical protein [Dyella mobilis]|uniref:Uncharacterized protein n=1 Tax=Dyella mobilis TaxID=1849582 RepID=A0ABS2KBF0_9GAMM|nr:hypothetical protein [Dyella mobilis]MBM7128501.1 hypothetical protein [Dyella mobilis]GLQ99598.1 hypothetical protein GCM10007863_40180 [Dyella mobilis]
MNGIQNNSVSHSSMSDGIDTGSAAKANLAADQQSMVKTNPSANFAQNTESTGNGEQSAAPMDFFQQLLDLGKQAMGMAGSFTSSMISMSPMGSSMGILQKLGSLVGLGK